MSRSLSPGFSSTPSWRGGLSLGPGSAVAAPFPGDPEVQSHLCWGSHSDLCWENIPVGKKGRDSRFGKRDAERRCSRRGLGLFLTPLPQTPLQGGTPLHGVTVSGPGAGSPAGSVRRLSSHAPATQGRCTRGLPPRTPPESHRRCF